MGGVAIDRGGSRHERMPSCGARHGLQLIELSFGGLRVQRRAARDGQKGAAFGDGGR